MKKTRTKRGRFITLEGVEGVGKSTHMQFVCNELRARGLTVLETREPGGTPEADEIRATLLKVRGDGFDPTAELLMMFAARALHVDKLIRPALAAGTWVVCDRFTDASYAYQGGGRGIRVTEIAKLERMVLKGLKPDLTLLLDVKVAVGMARARGRGELDRFEREKDAFFERVRRVYLARARKEPRRIKAVDAGQDIPSVQRDLAAVLDERLERWT
ncbi:MAG TPA: dTMP kinase [Gammaproteobacteria bacterium]|jgi:dTMP kinase|nr:dTMP kinase [Gammaproteobacteria bacterium]